MDDMDQEKVYESKMFKLLEFSGKNEYCLLHKKSGEKSTVKVSSVGQVSVIGIDEQGEKSVIMMSEIEEVEPIDHAEDINEVDILPHLKEGDSYN